MKLNNKGFAITSVLYGLLILFVSLVGTYLTVLLSKMNRLNNISDDINENYGFNRIKEVNITNFPYTTEYTGKYIFEIEEINHDCTTYLNKNIEVKYNNENLNIEFIEKDCNDRNDNKNIFNAKIKSIYYNGDDTDE